MEGDLFYNAGFGDYYLRINGNYYKRSNGKGWQATTEDKIPSPRWSQLQPAQWEAYKSGLKDAGLIE